VRAGKSVRARSGRYSKGFHTIIDANVVTPITGSSCSRRDRGRQGLRADAADRTVISLITAVAAHGRCWGCCAGFRCSRTPASWRGGRAAGQWLQIDFMRRRYLSGSRSPAIVLISAVSLGVSRLNLGIDFKGGTQVSFATTKPVPIGDVRKQTADIGFADAVVQGRGSLSGKDSYKSYQLRCARSPGQQSQLTQT